VFLKYSDIPQHGTSFDEGVRTFDVQVFEELSLIVAEEGGIGL